MTETRRNTSISSFLCLPNSLIFQRFLSFHEPLSLPVIFFLRNYGQLAASLAVWLTTRTGA